jgi:methylated-DNA-[protein]-cysteine S-methyltransferase
MTGPAAAFTTCPAPWGTIHVAATGRGVVALDLDTETAAFVDGLARRLHGPVVPMEDASVPAALRQLLDRTVKQVGEYLARTRRTFDLPVDLSPLSEWDRRVLSGAARLGYGEAVGYGELARRIGKPGAARAVGSAMSRNPVGLVIPCHRVIASDGTLGGYGGSSYDDRQAALARKRELLAHEGVSAEARR